MGTFYTFTLEVTLSDELNDTSNLGVMSAKIGKALENALQNGEGLSPDNDEFGFVTAVDIINENDETLTISI